MPSAGMGRRYGAEKSSVELNTVEIQRLAQFAERHAQCTVASRNPPRITVETVATGIGPAIKGLCNTCGGSEDISDIDCW